MTRKHEPHHASPRAVTDPLHDADFPATTWTSVNFAEGFPEVPTPLSWTWVREPTEFGLRRTAAGLGALPAHIAGRDGSSFIGIYHGRPVANLDLFRAMADAIPGTSGTELESSLFGSARPDVRDQPRRRRYPLVAARAPWSAWQSRRHLLRQQETTHRWWQRTVGAIENGAVDLARSAMLDARHRYTQITPLHGTCSIVAQAAYTQIQELCTALDHPGLETRIAAFGATETRMADDLAAVARGTSTLPAFLAEHGYQGSNASEITSTVWREDPELLARVLTALKTDNHAGRARASQIAAERRDALRELLHHASRTDRLRAQAVVGLAAQFLPLREIGRATFLKTYDVARAASRVIGVHLAAAGHIDAPADVAYLTVTEAADPRGQDWRDVVAWRRTRHAEHEKHQVPDLWTGSVVPVVADSAGQGDKSLNSIQGIGACAGVAEGTARIVLASNDETFQPGEILVCRTTDPGWVPLFELAVAAVIDIGSPVSHGAVVAREFGLPCVINTGNGTRTLRTGMQLRVDGRTGQVEILSA